MVKGNLELDTEQKIYSAATLIFERDGYAGARMQSIADEAGINKALLHYYFRSKEKLFSLVFLEKFNTFISALANLATNEDLEFYDKIDVIINAYMEMFMLNPDLPAMLINTINHHPEFLQHMNSDAGRILGNVFQKEIEKGTIIKTNPLQIITSLIGLCIMPFLAKPIIKEVFNTSEEDYSVFIKQRGDFVKRAMRLILQP